MMASGDQVEVVVVSVVLRKIGDVESRFSLSKFSVWILV